MKTAILYTMRTATRNFLKYKLYYCALFYIDANGVENGPNQFGADIYRFDLNYNGKFVSYTDILPVLTKGKLEYTPYEIGKPKE